MFNKKKKSPKISEYKWDIKGLKKLAEKVYKVEQEIKREELKKQCLSKNTN